MNIITTKEQLQQLVEYYSKVDGFAFDVETVGENRIQPVVNDVLWISLATDGRTDESQWVTLTETFYIGTKKCC